MSGKYADGDFNVMLSENGFMGSLSCIEQLCLEVTKKYCALST